jgi:Na+-translocating ferredoxin:NAD+ oxidoreductase RnfD subunit
VKKEKIETLMPTYGWIKNRKILKKIIFKMPAVLRCLTKLSNNNMASGTTNVYESAKCPNPILWYCGDRILTARAIKKQLKASTSCCFKIRYIITGVQMNERKIRRWRIPTR